MEISLREGEGFEPPYTPAAQQFSKPTQRATAREYVLSSAEKINSNLSRRLPAYQAVCPVGTELYAEPAALAVDDTRLA